MNRNLNIELVRILSMFLIILGHILGGFIPLGANGSDIFRGIFPAALCFYLPFHINLFVLISGYFGIKSVRKATRLYTLLFSYLLIVFLINLCGNFGQFDYWSLLLPISHNPWWFMRIYFLLVLVAPLMIEPLLIHLSSKSLYALIGTFLIVDIYFGFIWQEGSVHYGGYSLIHFITIYLIGGLLRRKKSVFTLFWDGSEKSLTASICFWLFAMTLFLKTICHYILKTCEIEDRFMDYNNPFNIIAAVTLFLGILQLKPIKSKSVLFVSSSVIGVYLLSEHPILRLELMRLFDEIVGLLSGNCLLEIPFVFLFIVALFFVAILIDKMRLYLIDKIKTCLSY